MKYYKPINTNCFNNSYFGPMSHSVTQPAGMTQLLAERLPHIGP